MKKVTYYSNGDDIVGSVNETGYDDEKEVYFCVVDLNIDKHNYKNIYANSQDDAVENAFLFFRSLTDPDTNIIIAN